MLSRGNVHATPGTVPRPRDGPGGELEPVLRPIDRAVPLPGADAPVTKVCSFDGGERDAGAKLRLRCEQPAWVDRHERTRRRPYQREWLLQGPDSNYLASAEGAGVAAQIAAAPQDVNISEGSLTKPGATVPDMGHTVPNDTMSTPAAINVTIDTMTIIDFNHGKFSSFQPTTFHPLSEFIAHEFGHVEAILNELSAGASTTRGWWKFVEPRTRANACKAGRARRAALGLTPKGHDECTADCRFVR